MYDMYILVVSNECGAGECGAGFSRVSQPVWLTACDSLKVAVSCEW